MDHPWSGPLLFNRLITLKTNKQWEEILKVDGFGEHRHIAVRKVEYGRVYLISIIISVRAMGIYLTFK